MGHFEIKWNRTGLELKLKEYKNDTIKSISMFALKLPRFFTRLNGEGNGNLKSTCLLTASSRSYIVLALILSVAQPFVPVIF